MSGTWSVRAIGSSGSSPSTCSRKRRTSRRWRVCIARREDLPGAPAGPGPPGPAGCLVHRLLHPVSHRRSRPDPAAPRRLRGGCAEIPRDDGLQRSVRCPVRTLPRRRLAGRLRPVGSPRRAGIQPGRRAHAGDVRAGGRRGGGRPRSGEPRRHRLGGAAKHAGRLRLDGRRVARAVDADVLARHHADPRLLRAVQSAAVVGPRLAGASRAAGDHPRALHDGAHHTADALGHARGAEPGLHPHGAGQGRERSARRLEACAAERGDPDRDHRGDRARHAARWLGHHRDDLRLAGRRPPVGPGDLQPRLSGGAGGGVPAFIDVRSRQPRRRRGLHLPRPADSPAVKMTGKGMSADAEPARVRLRPPADQAGLTVPAPNNSATTNPARREWAMFIRRLARRRTALFGLVVVMLVVVAALGAPWIAAYDPTEQNITDRLKPPGSLDAAGRAHVLGTDHLGRDILARVLYGARPALMVGFAAVAISGVLGMMVGLFSGYFGGRLDDVFMRLAHIQLAFALILLAIAVIGGLGRSLPVIIVVIGVSSWVVYARVVRGAVLSLREREFVQAAHALGSRDGRVLMRHILPNAFTPWLVVATLDM